MRSRLPTLVCLILLSSTFPPIIFASGFQLKTVGNLNVDGAVLTHLWYTNGNLTFTGTALSQAVVTTAVDGTTGTTTADVSGNWRYSASLAEGDHQVSFTSNESTIAFTLTIGQAPADISALPTTEMPTAGVVAPSLAMLTVGASLLSFSLLLKRKFI